MKFMLGKYARFNSLFSRVSSPFYLAWLGVIIGIVAFTYQYYLVHSSFFGYKWLTAPARLSLSFFSEETAFWPKMLIFLIGQYVGYLTIIWFLKWFISLFKQQK